MYGVQKRVSLAMLHSNKFKFGGKFKMYGVQKEVDTEALLRKHYEFKETFFFRKTGV